MYKETSILIHNRRLPYSVLVIPVRNVEVFKNNIQHTGYHTSVFPEACRGPHSRLHCQSCRPGQRQVKGSEERISGSSESSFSVSDADAVTVAAWGVWGEVSHL